MTNTSDLKQVAALRVFRRGKLDVNNPYSGAYYHATFRTTKLDAFRRQSSQERRKSKLSELSTASVCLERYSADRRYDRRGLNSDDPAKIVEAREELELSRQETQYLSPHHRSLIERCDLNQEPVGEVAISLGETKCAVRSRLFHAHQKLRAQLERRGLAAS